MCAQVRQPAADYLCAALSEYIEDLDSEKLSGEVLRMTSPLFAAALASACLGERWRGREALAALVALGGVALVTRPPFLFAGGEGVDALGAAFAIAAALSAAGAMVLVRALGTRVKVAWPIVMLYQALGPVS